MEKPILTLFKFKNHSTTNFSRYLFCLLLAFLTLPTTFAEDFDTWHELHEARVLNVIDGDTIEIRFSDKAPKGCERTEKVRLIGVDSPELSRKIPEYFSAQAKDFTEKMLLGKTIYIELDDTGLKDYFGRLLAYVRQPNSKENQKLYKNYCDVNSITSVLNNDTFLFNEAIILAGYSYYYGKYPFNKAYMTRFESAEEMAEVLVRGIWQ